MNGMEVTTLPPPAVAAHCSVTWLLRSCCPEPLALGALIPVTVTIISGVGTGASAGMVHGVVKC